MDAKDAEQIAHLKTQCVPASFLARLYGIDWPPGGDFPADFAHWLGTRAYRPVCDGGLGSRWVAETFLRDHRLRPLPWAAARLGLKPDSLKGLLAAMPGMGLRRNYEVYPGLVDESVGEDLIQSLKGLRFRTFGTHDAFCETLHAAIAQQTGLKPAAWHCATSVKLEEYPRLFAYHLDSITLEPLSVRHSVWLESGKPLHLDPDRFSKLFYVAHREELRPLIAGRGEPEGLGYYERAVTTEDR